MDFFYINVDLAEERKRHLVNNFANHKKPGWTMTCFPAIDTVYVAQSVDFVPKDVVS